MYHHLGRVPELLQEEATIKGAVEKIDGLGKPVSLKTLQDWCEDARAGPWRVRIKRTNMYLSK